jgi:6-phosphogluconolactonase
MAGGVLNKVKIQKSKLKSKTKTNFFGYMEISTLKRRKGMIKRVKTYRSLDCLSHDAARRIAFYARKEINAKGYFTIAVSGGSDPVLLYKLLAKSKIKWDSVFMFWQDDRFVDYGHKDSNVKLVFDNLMKKAKIRFDRVFPAPSPSHIKDPVKAAFAYETIIRRIFFRLSPKSKIPQFDLIIAGVGPDGHTASLFPKDKKALNEKKRLVISVKAPEYAVVKDRISMTLPLINNAKEVLFIVSGKGKAETMKGIMKGDKKYPAARVKAANKLIWMIDKASL